MSGAWAPLARPAYRALWLAQLGSNVGTWMQTVGAQWILVGEPDAATLVALVQTASTLPVLLLALPSGVLADILDRRRLLIAVQSFMTVVAGVLAVVTAGGLTTPVVLLGLTFLLGCGQALTTPAWQAIQPELVPREEIPAAAALGSLAMNVARAVGPALAGFIVAVTGPQAVFALNAVSFVGVTLAVIAWRRPAEDEEMRAERALAALRAGPRYVRNAPVVRRLLLRAGLFVIPGSAIWALLPLVAGHELGLDAGGYGVLLGALGIGAIAGALGLSRIRRLSANTLLVMGAALFGFASLALAVLDDAVLASIVLVAAGFGWLVELSTLNAGLQLSLPAWVRARGLSAYQLVFLGGQAAGSLLWGLVASWTSTGTALAAAGVLLIAVAASVALLPLSPRTAVLDRSTSSHWPAPNLVLEPQPDDGPVLVLSTYTVRPPNAEAFLTAMEAVGRSRRRSGAVRWSVFQDGADPERYVEAFLVSSWDEHLRQHDGRLTASDRDLEIRAAALAEGAPVVEHLLAARAGSGADVVVGVPGALDPPGEDGEQAAGEPGDRRDGGG